MIFIAKASACKQNTINGHEKQSLWLDNLKQLVKVGEDLDDHLLLSQLGAWIVSVRTIMNDAIHIQVQVVDQRSFANIGWLIEQRISLAQPAIERRNACKPTMCNSSYY